MSSQLIITGMHRSATSLAASLLQGAGLQIGRYLLGPLRGNAKGHFEDVEIVILHQEVLAAAGESRTGFTTRCNIPVQAEQALRAQQIVDQRLGEYCFWGWKDPRGTLFLPFWANLLPNAGFVLLYRSPWEVMASLYTRGDLEFFWKPARAAEIWVHYNRLLLEHARKFPSRVILVPSSELINRPKHALETIAQHFGAKLEQPAALVDPDLFHASPPDDDLIDSLASLYPEALSLYQAMGSQQNYFPPPGCYRPRRTLSRDEAKKVIEQRMSQCRAELVAALQTGRA